MNPRSEKPGKISGAFSLLLRQKGLGPPAPARGHPPKIQRKGAREWTILDAGQPGMRLEKIVSGGQIGGDQGGLEAAEEFGLATGGWAPRGWRTEAGPAPWLGTRFGLVEHAERHYLPRTECNVILGTGTMRFAEDFLSPGELWTLKFCLRHKKPHYDIDLKMARTLGKNGLFTMCDSAARWIVDNRIVVLNVTGNARSEIQPYVKGILLAVLTLVKEKDP